MRHAIVREGVVRNIIVGSVPGSVPIGTDPVVIGWLYDGNAFTPPPVPPTPKNAYPWADFLEALTDNELDALITLKQTSAPLKRFLAIIEARGHIDFNHAKPQQFLTFLVNQAVLTAPRALALRG